MNSCIDDFGILWCSRLPTGRLLFLGQKNHLFIGNQLLLLRGFIGQLLQIVHVPFLVEGFSMFEHIVQFNRHTLAD